MDLLILGPPGSGKGTLAKMICDHYGAMHISTGDLFRENIKNKTELGELASGYIKRGDLVPDEVTIAMVEDCLSKLPHNKSFLLDGFPRTVQQADALEVILKKLGRSLNAAINVSLSDEIIAHRIAGRRMCRDCGASYNVDLMPSKVDGICDRCGGELYQRPDDKPETVVNRLATYHDKTKPLIDYYSAHDIMIDADNSGSAEETAATIFKALEK